MTGVLLAVDIGNTDVAWATYGPDGGRLETGRTPVRAGAGEALAAAATGRRPAGAGIASVVPGLVEPVRAALERAGVRARILSPADVPIRLEVDRPEEVGIDRAVNAWMGSRRHGAPLVVVDLGTATTFDAVSAGGEYVGGAIAAGLRTGLAALLRAAALLGRIDPDEVLTGAPDPIGRGTVAALRSGAVIGHAEMIDGMVRRFRAALGGGRAVATGGLAPLVAPWAAEIAAVDPHLTLDGIFEIIKGSDPDKGDNFSTTA